MVKVYKKKAVKRSGDGADENDENQPNYVKHMEWFQPYIEERPRYYFYHN